MNIILDKKKAIFSVLFFIVFGIIISLNYKLYIIDDNFNIGMFLLSILLLSFSSCILSVKINFTDKVNRFITILTFALSIIISYIIIELLNRNNMFSIDYKRLFFNFIVILFVHLSILLLTNRTKLTIILSNSLVFILGLVNYVVTNFRGTPIVPWDFLTISTAATVAGTYTLTLDYYIFIAVILFALLLSIAINLKHTIKTTKINLILRSACLFAIIGFVGQFYKTDIIDYFEFETNLWQPTIEYSNNGFLASFVKQSKNLFTQKPEDYSVEEINEITDTYVDVDASEFPDEKPNIIVIMNESFSDLSINTPFKTNEDYMPYYRSLNTNVIKGTAHVSIFGAPTPNSEWEFLTNNSMAFMPYRTIPYQQYIKGRSPSLATTLKSQGYTTSSIHPWYGSGYRRNAVYPLLGFESFDSIETLKGLEYIRQYPSDLSTYRKIIEMFENKNEEEKIFNFTVTMQNHSGYDLEDYDSTIFLEDIEDCPRVEQYLSLIKESDSALQYLIEYFSNVEEKTIIVFFGDHQPPYLEDTFWDYVVPNWESNESTYLIPYMLWANYDIEEKHVPDISLNYLSVLLLDVANLPTTPYMNFLRELQETLPVITGNGYIDYLGNSYSFDSSNSEYADLLKRYQMIQYNNVFDTSNRVNRLFAIETK